MAAGHAAALSCGRGPGADERVVRGESAPAQDLYDRSEAASGKGTFEGADWTPAERVANPVITPDAVVAGAVQGLDMDRVPISPLEGAPEIRWHVGDVLRAAEAGERVRISVFGASHTEADYFTGHMRRLLQARFGDIGHGFIWPADPVAQYRANDVNLCYSPGWRGDFVGRSDGRRDGLYGLGASVSSSDPSAFGWLETTHTNRWAAGSGATTCSRWAARGGTLSSLSTMRPRAPSRPTPASPAAPSCGGAGQGPASEASSHPRGLCRTSGPRRHRGCHRHRGRQAHAPMGPDPLQQSMQPRPDMVVLAYRTMKPQTRPTRWSGMQTTACCAASNARSDPRRRVRARRPHRPCQEGRRRAVLHLVAPQRSRVSVAWPGVGCASGTGRRTWGSGLGAGVAYAVSAPVQCGLHPPDPAWV